MNEHYTNKVKSFTLESIEELEDELNRFYENKFVIATQIFQVKEGWSAMVYYKLAPVLLKEDFKPMGWELACKPKEVIKEIDKATTKQMNYLKILGYHGTKDITMTEARALIKELKK